MEKKRKASGDKDDCLPRSKRTATAQRSDREHLTKRALRHLPGPVDEEDRVRDWSSSVRRAISTHCETGTLDLAHGCSKRPPSARPSASSRASTPVSAACGVRKRRSDTSSSITTPSVSRSIRTIQDPRVPEVLESDGIRPPRESQAPANQQDLLDWMARDRASLSPTRFPADKMFDNFSRDVEEAANESGVMTDIAPFLLGGPLRRYPGGVNTAFNALEPLTSTSIPPPKPDYWDCARGSTLHRHVREDLGRYIVPTNNPNLVCPNFSLEAKGPDGHEPTVRTQAVYNGASHARGMHKLQHYGEPHSAYDKKATAVTITFFQGVVTYYSTHVAPPSAGQITPEYHTCLIGKKLMVESKDAMLSGIRSVRNLRDWAASCRDASIEEANKRTPDSTLSQDPTMSKHTATPALLPSPALPSPTSQVPTQSLAPRSPLTQTEPAT